MPRQPGARPPGRPSRGERYTFHVRLPLEHLERYLDEAASRSMALSDYVCGRLAEAHGLEVPGYIQPKVPDLAVVPVADHPRLLETTTWGKRVCVRVPVAHRAVYAERAAADSATLSDYTRDCLARLHHLAAVPVHPAQEADLLSA